MVAVRRERCFHSPLAFPVHVLGRMGCTPDTEYQLHRSRTRLDDDSPQPMICPGDPHRPIARHDRRDSSYLHSRRQPGPCCPPFALFLRLIVGTHFAHFVCFVASHHGHFQTSFEPTQQPGSSQIKAHECRPEQISGETAYQVHPAENHRAMLKRLAVWQATESFGSQAPSVRAKRQGASASLSIVP